MSESAGGAAFKEDGCNYMTKEERLAFFKMITPREFDSSRIRNKVLNVSYGLLPEHLADIYMPETGAGPFPVIFYVHGGGWTQGSKTEGFLDGIIGAVDSGYAVVSVDYRLAPKVSFPEFLFDIKTAVRWARAKAGEYGFDPDRFAMTGDSAGGHLTLMAGFTAGRPEYSDAKYGFAGYSDELQAICDMYGPSVLAGPTARFYLDSGVKRVARDAANRPDDYEVAFGTANPNLLTLISPIRHVHKDIPPTLIMHGVQDGVVPYQHSTLLFEKIKEVCGEGKAELVLYEDRNHADFAFNTKENCDTVLKFFDKYLK
ncbi:MAG: alpha/beta hydrolase [Peptococcaceae bacterium]|nr:alpha/beta hydrolase [Peptococcaceae bacterium]